MPKGTYPANDLPGRPIERYRPAARVFHWLTVLLLAVQFPAGLTMVYRGPGLNIWDAMTNTLYAGHKVVGVSIFLLIVTRLLYRLIAGVPAPEPTLAGWQSTVSVLNHWGMYLLLVVVPSLGYLAICYFPALNIFPGFSFPAIVGPDRAKYTVIIGWHAVGAFTLAGLVSLHVVAVLYHRFIRRDNVLARMLFGGSD